MHTSLIPAGKSYVSSDVIWDQFRPNFPLWRNLYVTLRNSTFVQKQDVLKILQVASQILVGEPNLVYLESPITICGDVHGQLYDLAPLFARGGQPDERKYLFLGDYVDRGAWSTEVALMLMALKVAYPQQINLLRGNHEAREITARYGFREDCLRKYDAEVYDMFMRAFDCLPLAAVVDQTFFCVHGGISPKMANVGDINRIQRVQELPLEDCLANDLLWSDPVDSASGAQESPYVFNDERGCATRFGKEALSRFLAANSLTAVIRAHQVFFEGYCAHNWENKPLWQICTVFSAPNYTGYYQNIAAVIKVDVNLSEPNS